MVDHTTTEMIAKSTFTGGFVFEKDGTIVTDPSRMHITAFDDTGRKIQITVNREQASEIISGLASSLK